MNITSMSGVAFLDCDCVQLPTDQSCMRFLICNRMLFLTSLLGYFQWRVLICAAWKMTRVSAEILRGISQACEREFDQGLGRTLGGNALRGGSHSTVTLYNILVVDNDGSLRVGIQGAASFGDLGL